MRNQVNLFVFYGVVLAVVSITVRLRQQGIPMRFSEAIKRGWKQVAHPERRGMPDPSLSQIAISMIALGSLLVAISATTSSTVSTSHGTTVHPQPVYLWIGVVLTAIGVVGVAMLGFVAIMRRRDDQKTPFCIDHIPGTDDYEEDLDDTVYDTDGTSGRIVSQQVRVCVTNAGNIGVQHVRAYLTVLQGGGRNFFLHLQHDNDPTRHVSRNGEYMTIGQRTFFDVAFVRTIGWKSARVGFAISYADPAIESMSFITPLRKLEYDVRITVSGWTDFRDVVPRSKDFRISVDEETYDLSLTELS